MENLLDHKGSLSKFQGIDIMWATFTDHNWLTLEVLTKEISVVYIILNVRFYINKQSWG